MVGAPINDFPPQTKNQTGVGPFFPVFGLPLASLFSHVFLLVIFISCHFSVFYYIYIRVFHFFHFYS